MGQNAPRPEAGRTRHSSLRWSTDAPGWVEGLRVRASPNCDRRPPGISIDTLILHFISLPPGVFHGDAVERLFCNRLKQTGASWEQALRGLRVSAHFVIRRRGETTQYVSGDDRAWHAGPSLLLGRERCNDFSIGIELEGDGEHKFTDAQYRRLDQLTATLCTRYPLSWVAGHSDIAPGRKFDPGPLFDWDRALAGPGFSRLRRPF